MRHVVSLIAALILGPGAGAFQPGPVVQVTRDGLDKERPSWSPDGKRLTFSRQEPDSEHMWQYLIEPGPGSSARRLTDRKTPDYHGVFSPDGKRILLVAVAQSGTQGNLDIGLVPAEGGEVRTVAGDHNGQLSHQDWPAWSPDGRRFAFSSTHDGNQEIYTAAADGSDLVRLTQSPGLDAHPCWSPDGESILFATDRWGGLEIASVRPDGSGVTRLTESPGLDDYPAVAPDGKRIAFVSNRDGQFEIYVMGADGSSPTNLTRSPARESFPTWTPDGTGVTFVSNRGRGFDIYTQAVVPARAASQREFLPTRGSE